MGKQEKNDPETWLNPALPNDVREANHKMVCTGYRPGPQSECQCCLRAKDSCMCTEKEE